MLHYPTVYRHSSSTFAPPLQHNLHTSTLAQPSHLYSSSTFTPPQQGLPWSIIYGRMVPQAPQLPQSLSLNDLLRRHCRDRLYVPPLRWTAQHVQLLKCRFVPRPHTSQPTSSTQTCFYPPSKSEQAGEGSKQPPKQEDISLRRALCRLARGNDLLFKQWGLERLLRTFSNNHIITSLP